MVYLVVVLVVVVVKVLVTYYSRVVNDEDDGNFERCECQQRRAQSADLVRLFREYLVV